jgi:hypothetical protein
MFLFTGAPMPDRDSPLVKWHTENNIEAPLPDFVEPLHELPPAVLEPLTFDFPHAIHLMKQGKRVARSVWSKDVYLRIQFPDHGSKMSHPYIYVTSRFGLVPWVATQVEMLTEDWILVGGA